jgi:DNA-binding GntR family transcriptional regulator
MLMPDDQSDLGLDRTERKPSLVASAYEAVKQAIRDGVFPPGFQGSEQEMAQRLGMSRTPVHQAIVQLQSEGMVELRPKRGVVIRALTPYDMKEVYDVIIAVEGMAALLLAEKPAAERDLVCRELDAINAQVAAALEADNLNAWAEHDARFHATLVHEAGNSRLERIARVNSDQSYRARRMTLSLRPKPFVSIEEHQQIISAIARGDPARARETAQDHKIRARELVVEVLRRHDMKHL